MKASKSRRQSYLVRFTNSQHNDVRECRVKACSPQQAIQTIACRPWNVDVHVVVWTPQGEQIVR
jgi:hypothetical protein